MDRPDSPPAPRPARRSTGTPGPRPQAPRGRLRHHALAAVAALLALAWAVPASAQVRVPRAQIQDLIRGQVDQGYNLTVVTQATRFSATVLLELARTARAADPTGPPLLVHHDDWYAAYRDALGLADDEVPAFMALQRTYGQDQVVYFDHASTAHRVEEGPEPGLVLRVEAGWPDGPDAADRYTFVDSLADPPIRVVNEREISYFLLDFDSMVVQDEIEGVGGRPLGGALGAAFSVIGDGWAKQSRFALASDGTLVTYARAAKGFVKVNQLTTTTPDGVAVEDTPPDRPDLDALARRLQQDLEVDYPGR